LRISVGLDPATGKYKSRTKRFAGTYTEAQQELRAFTCSVEAGKSSAKTKYTVGSYVDEFIALRKASGEYAYGTWQKDVSYFKCVKRLLGHSNIASVTPLMIEKAYAAMRNGDSPSGKKLSGTYFGSIHASLYGLFEHAKNHDVISANPCEKIKPPKSDTAEKKALKTEAMSAFISSLDFTNPNHIALLMCATMGVRRGEALALCWGDVDFGERSVFISGSIDETGAVKSPKTKAGIRRLPMPEIAFDALRVRKAAQKADFEQTRSAISIVGSTPLEPCQKPTTPIASNLIGGFILPHSLSTWWRRHRGDFGMDEWTIHELRHSYLSALAVAGVHPKVMQELAGHASSSTTLEIYSHVDFTAKSAAANAFESLVF
ncbi:MAG: site-specific integrase, partial [Raoultibacter sp.]